MASRGRSRTRKNLPTRSVDTLIDAVVFRLSFSILVFVPLAFSTSVYRVFTLPKYLILLTGSSALVPLLAYRALLAIRGRRISRLAPRSKLTLLVLTYVAIIAFSTILGVEPVASLFGTFENRLGLVTRLCFLICFVGLTIGVGKSRVRVIQVLWGVVFTGFAAATYAFVQFFGRDPFLPPSIYLFESGGRTLVRAVGTLGHPNYLGNFLLYTTPLTASVAIAYQGIARRFCVAATAISVAAIAFSGTRGAWLGLIAGGAILIGVELLTRRGKVFAGPRSQFIRRAVIGISILSVSVWLVASTGVSRNIVARARLLVSETDKGAGRTLLWRDSLKMVSASPLVGCGPDAFRRAFLSYKSYELARFAPDINNESSHNSYIDSAVSFGLPGAILLVAIIAATFSLLWSARRRTSDRRLRLIITGLFSSFAAVAIHNIFIFDQISTGLYFFSFVAFASLISRVAAAEDTKAQETASSDLSSDGTMGRSDRATIYTRTAVCALTLSGLAVLGAVSYSVLEMSADNRIGRALMAASQGNLDQVMSSANSATQVFDPDGGFGLLAARAVAVCIDQINQSERATQPGGSGKAISPAKRAAINLAIAHAQRSLAHTLTPDSSYVLLAYLAFLGGDAERLREFASEAVRWDPKFANARWLLAEAYLAAGDREQAVGEAKFALEIVPSSPQARSALERAQGEFETRRLKLEKAIAHARVMFSKGHLTRAESVLRRAISRSQGQCPECHRLLASIYEADHLYDNAIAEWQTFVAQAPDRVSAEDAEKRISALRQMSGLRK